MGYPRAEGRVRYVPEVGFELQCRSCNIYVLLDPELWTPASGLTRCRACWNEYQRLRMAGKRKDEISASLMRTRQRLSYAMNAQKRRESSRRWREANPEKVRASRRAYYLRNRERAIAQAKSYYDECRDVVVAQKRARRAEARAA